MMKDINFIYLTGSVRSPAVVSLDGSVCQITILHEQGSAHQDVVLVAMEQAAQKMLATVTDSTVGLRVAVSGSLMIGVPTSEGIYINCRTLQFIDVLPEQTGITFEDD